jgi:hypothetical protein
MKEQLKLYEKQIRLLLVLKIEWRNYHVWKKIEWRNYHVLNVKTKGQ